MSPNTKITTPATLEATRCYRLARDRADYCKKEADLREQSGGTRAADIWDARAAEADFLAALIQWEFRL